MELRCPGRLHGVVVADGRIEIKCRSNRCGANSETTVLHYFDRETGDLVETQKFKEPTTIFQKERIR